MKFGGLQALFLGAFLAFSPAVLAQDVEHLSLPASGITDRPLPPARDGGIYLPHVSGGGAPIAKAKTAKAAKVAKTKKTLKKEKAKGKAAVASVKTKSKATAKAKTQNVAQKTHKAKDVAKKTKAAKSAAPKIKSKVKR